MKVLIAEDDTDQRLMLSDILLEEGYVVDAVANGVDALRAIKSTSYDIALFDVRMPGKDGLTALKELRQSKSTLPVIVMSAFPSAVDEARHFASGATASLPKPYDVEELLALIANTIKASTNPDSK